MKLIYSKNKQEVCIGDRVELQHDGWMYVAVIQKPRSPASTGRVSVCKLKKDIDNFARHHSYYPSVIGAEWIDREDREEKEITLDTFKDEMGRDYLEDVDPATINELLDTGSITVSEKGKTYVVSLKIERE